MHHSHDDFDDFMGFMFFQEQEKEQAINKAVDECVRQINMGRTQISAPRGDLTDEDIEKVKQRVKDRTGCKIYD